MDQTVLVHAFTHIGLAQQVNHALFQHTGADTAEHILGALAFDDDVAYTGLEQQLTKQQAGWASADDGDLSLLCYCP
jgi:hypothetical protein